MLNVYRIRLNRSGYAADGSYYGAGLPVYMVEPDGQPCTVTCTLRAPDARAARARYLAAAEFGPAGVLQLHATGRVPEWAPVARVGLAWLQQPA